MADGLAMIRETGLEVLPLSLRREAESVILGTGELLNDLTLSHLIANCQVLTTVSQIIEFGLVVIDEG